MIVADIYFIYVILDIIAPSKEYKKAFEKHKVPMLLNHAAYTLITTIAIITIVIVGSGAILASLLIALIITVPLFAYTTANLVVGRLLFFEELVKEEKLFLVAEVPQKPKRKLNLDAID